MVKNKVTSKHPSFIGPALIHQDHKYGTYYYYASEIKKIHLSVQNLMAIGTDGEETLSSAFLSVSQIVYICSVASISGKTLYVNSVSQRLMK